MPKLDRLRTFKEGLLIFQKCLDFQRLKNDIEGLKCFYENDFNNDKKELKRNDISANAEGLKINLKNSKKEYDKYKKVLDAVEILKNLDYYYLR